MRSKVHFRGHPIHPALVHFPLAFLIGAFGFDLAGKLATAPQLELVASWLVPVGIVTGLLAAIPGLLDYLYTVPPQSSGKRRATWHLALNVTALVLFAVAWWRRGGFGGPPDLAVLAGEALGTIFLTISGYLGSILVARNQIGVDHRYAEAGKWKEARSEPNREGDLVVARAGELAVDQMKLLHVAGRRIVLARTEDGYTAFDDHCTHRGGSLADGVMISGQVQCPWHGSQFDVRTGAVVNGPAREPINTYYVEEKENRVILHLDKARRELPGRREIPVGRR
ncbi:MAG: DUF2231 domain-containing protein [Gemmatimonadales bacterium]